MRKINKNMFLKRKGIDSFAAQSIIILIMTSIVFLVVLPLLITIISSFKSNYEILTGIWVMPSILVWKNWTVGFSNILPNMMNSIIISSVTTIFVVFLGSISAYVFVRQKFLGKKVLFNLIIVLMIIPSVLTLTPLYVLMLTLDLKNTWFAIWFPTIAGGQISAIFLFSTFLGQQPESLFDAAKIDGASEFEMYMRISLPLAIPVLAIQAVSTFSGAYNDFLWPALIIDEQSKQALMPILKNLTATVATVNNAQGAMYAMYLFSGIPLVFTTLFGLKYFIKGDFASGLKL